MNGTDITDSNRTELESNLTFQGREMRVKTLKPASQPHHNMQSNGGSSSRQRGSSRKAAAPKRGTALLRYPFVGKLVRCTDRGFGFIQYASTEIMIHINAYMGPLLQTMDGLDGQYCAFAIGGSTYEYIKSKPGWESSVIQWVLLDDIEHGFTPELYRAARTIELQSMDRGLFFTTLAAEWYVRMWEQKTNTPPKSMLFSDDLLEQTLKEALSHCGNAEELIRLLGEIFASPYYALDAADSRKACKRFFCPDQWDKRVFIPNRPPEECRFYAKVWPLCGAVIQDGMTQARTVAIDLEADGRRIWEYGWENAAGVGRKTDPHDLSNEDLQSALQESLLSQQSPCIVGHNLLNWDLPRLQERNVYFPELAELWDTLIGAWVLEPWMSSHALIVKENAHRADADAKASYELFKQQVARLAPCFDGHGRDIRLLVDSLLDESHKLSAVKNRLYPYDSRNKVGTSVLCPRNRIKEKAWQRGCRIHYTTPEMRLKDPTLSPEICSRLANESGHILAKTVAVIVNDAAANGVQVRLSMLPSWLADQSERARLQEAHINYDFSVTDNAECLVYIAEDLYSQPWETCAGFMKERKLSSDYPLEVILAWQNAYAQILDEKEVRAHFPKVIEGRVGRAVLPVTDRDRGLVWLLYAPPGLGEPDASWQLLPTVPKELATIRPSHDADRKSHLWAVLPRWRDGALSTLDVDRLFVTPETANRRLYLADVMHAVLNLLKTLPKNKILICAMRWPSEAAELQNSFAQLSLSVLHSDAPLRQIERVRGESLRIVACCHADIPRYVEAATSLEISFRIAIDELPLHTWYCILNAPEEPSHASEAAYEGSLGGDDEENDAIGEDIVKGIAENQALQINLNACDIQKATALCLAPWLEAVLTQTTVPDAPVIILDSRLFDQLSKRGVALPREDFPFYPMEELLDEKRLNVYNQVCFPRRKTEDIPNDYNSYRAFLEKNWGYPDFLYGTQRPAIEALVNTQRDLLLRLPTGAGKSEVFQVPALLRAHYSGRLSIVITPLRALMKDQVHRLWQRNFSEEVDYLSGGREAWINRDVYQGVLDGRIKLLYIAPERFRVPRFIEVLERRRRMDGGLEFLVFDEVHCVSEWGFEFRPDYLFAAQYVNEWFRNKGLPGNPHRLLLTSATVTQRNQKDLERELGLRPSEYDDLPKDMPHPIQPFIVIESCDLPENDEPTVDDKFQKILDVLGKLDLSKSAALVFVRRRKDCHSISEALNEEAAISGSAIAQLHALPFHAGLPETVKSEASDLLKARNVNVLVCTKAFGMGMDVPHLHACVHYRPPTFIEDYLQEVGRIGRSQEERVGTGHEQVTATLLFNHENLEQNLGLLHDKAVRPPDLQDFFGYCLRSAVSFKQVGKAVCILPAAVRINDSKAFDENQVTNCLFWLERMTVLKVEGRHPAFLSLTISTSKLKIISAAQTEVAVVACALLGIIEETNRVMVEQQVTGEFGTDNKAAESSFSRFMRGLVRGVLALVSTPSSASPKNSTPAVHATRMLTSTNDQDVVDVSVSMSELMAASGGISPDELYARLVDLTQTSALSLHKELVVLRVSAPSDNATYWILLQHAVERLIRPTGGGVELLARSNFVEELKTWYRGVLLQKTPAREGEMLAPIGDLANNALDAAHKKQIQREVYRAVATALKLVRYAYSRQALEENLASDGTMQYARAMPQTSIAAVKRGITERQEAMQKLVSEFSKHEPQGGSNDKTPFKIDLVTILNALGKDIRISRLQEVVNLVATSGFYGLESSTNDWISFVSLNRLAPLPPHDAEVVNADTGGDKSVPKELALIQTTYVEMLQKHELQVLRAQCMVLFTAIPTENRKQFIDRYFQCLTAKDLQGALEDAVGEVDDDVLANNQLLQDLLVQVRRERFGKEMERLNEEQFKVCAAPYNAKMLVNAGPGSGKTHVLMMRCAHLIHAQNIKPAEILVLAFNRAVVFEIRDRIRELFRELGYGSYVRKLDVSTFHGFALRHQQATDMYEDDAIGEAVHTFAQAVSTNEALARRIAGTYKAILVDEFQDMNEDFYAVVQALVTHSIGGAMVIGDDDQDILTWNRNKWKQKHGTHCPLEAFEYFHNFREMFTPENYELLLNYRSVPEIVSRANGMIVKASVHLPFTRMKSEITLEAHRSESGAVTLPFNSDDLEAVVQQTINRQSGNKGTETLAILCRSNMECRQVYRRLATQENIRAEWLEVLGSEDFALYQLRPTGTIMDMCARRNEWDFVEQLTWDDMLEEYKLLGHADMLDGVGELKALYQLLRRERGRPRMREVMEFIQEMRASDIERLKAKAGLRAQSVRITISTVHKVKGLQYDTVVVMPSSEKFPLTSNKNSVNISSIDAAEEARLCYVAMTRARNQLYVGWNGRERAWWEVQQFAGSGQNVTCSLKGSPKEIFVSWAGQTQQVEQGLQDYIEKHINRGDTLELRYGKALYHKEKKVGSLSTQTENAIKESNDQLPLRVANVLRYSCGKYFEEHNSDFWQKLHNSVKQRRWFYIITVELG